HQVAVEHPAALVYEWRDRLEDDGPDRHGLDEVAVADVEVEDAAPGAQEHVDLLPEAREVRRVERRLDLGVPHPIPPRHAAIVRSPALEPRPERSRPVPGTGRVRKRHARGVRAGHERPACRHVAAIATRSCVDMSGTWFRTRLELTCSVAGEASGEEPAR